MPKRTREQRGRRKAVIFDFDGTIADSFAYVFDFLKREAGNTTTYNEAELAEFRKLSMEELALSLGVPVWRLLFTYFRGRRAMREHMEQVRPFKGVVEVVRQLHADGYSLYIASSNSHKNILRMLRREGIADCFVAVRGGAGFAGKPAIIRSLLLRYRLPAQTTWYVGDETGDIVSARRAGVRSLAVGWGFADPDRLKQVEPDEYADQPTDVVRIVAAAWKK